MTLTGNTSLTMTTTKAFLTGQKQQQQLCCTTKVHCINMAGSAQHNKHNKAEQSQCVDLWHLWDRTNSQRNQVIKQLDEGDGTRQIAKQQTNTVSLRHTTNTAQLKNALHKTHLFVLKMFVRMQILIKLYLCYRFTCLFTCFVFVYNGVKFYSMLWWNNL